MTDPFQLFLFTREPDLARRSLAAGVDGLVIDWECDGKHHRQAAADTEINGDTVADLRRLRTLTRAPILCRINPIGTTTREEIENAIDGGATEILLPMVRRPEDVETALELVRGRVRVGILIETIDAVERAEELGRLPVSRVFLGLNDLSIERRTPSIFSAIADGTVEHVRAACSAPFGFAGMTVPEAGDPLPARLVIGELARLGCAFTFLRRSFRRDTAGRNLGVEVPRMREALAVASRRSAELVYADRETLAGLVRELELRSTAEPVALTA